MAPLLGNGDINSKGRKFGPLKGRDQVYYSHEANDTAVGLQKQCTASWVIPKQHNSQAGGPAKHRH